MTEAPKLAEVRERLEHVVRDGLGSIRRHDLTAADLRALLADHARLTAQVEAAYREGFRDAERAMDVRHVDYVRGNVIAALGDYGKLAAEDLRRAASLSPEEGV